MKKVTFIALAFAAVAAVFTSCKDEVKDAPVIALTNIADSISSLIIDGSSYDLTIKIDAAAELKEVVISETKSGTKTDKETIKEFTDAASLTKVYAVSGITADGIKITISATDKDDQNTTREITIKMKEVVIPALTVVAITADQGDAMIGAGGSAYGSYVDLDGGKIYHSKNVAANQAAIDAVFNLTSLYDKGTGFTSTNCKFGTTTLDATAFAAAKEDALSGKTADKTEITLTAGQVVYFKTGAGVEGLILIKTLTAESAAGKNDASLAIEVKIKK